MSRVHAWLELARLSNLPTVWTNVLAGAALGAAGAADASIDVTRTGIVMASASALYIAGMIGNDVLDARIDAERRAARPIPTGRIARGTAAVVAGAFVIIGLGLAALAGGATLAWAGGLTAAIIGYDVLHHRWPPSIMLMGVCRALVILMAANTLTVLTGAAAGAIAFYIVLLTLFARREHRPEGFGRRGAWLMLVPWSALWIAGANVPRAREATLVAVGLTIAASCFVLLAARRPAPPRAVSGWLAALCLYDALACAIVGAIPFAGAALLGFGLTVAAHRKVSGS